MVGGLLANVSPEQETAKLNECAENGWELVTVLSRRHGRHGYIFYYLKRKNTGEKPKYEPRFDIKLLAS
jgi:hypothetical protein